MLRHFGEDPPERCGNCDNCLNPPKTIDVTTVARKILSAAFRTEMRFGVAHLAAVLGGDDNAKVRAADHHRLSVFGIMDKDELALVRPVARSLIARDALRSDAFGGLSFGPAAKAILKGEDKVVIAEPPRRRRPGKKRNSDVYPPDPLFDRLRDWRRDTAKTASVPPYVIFHDRTLRAISAGKPTVLAALGQIEGIGAAKLERFGADILNIVGSQGS